MTAINKGDWVRYTDDFCQQTSTTSMGLADMASRRGLVTHIFSDGQHCSVDWGDVIVQFRLDSPSIVVSESPYASSLADGGAPDDAEPETISPRPR